MKMAVKGSTEGTPFNSGGRRREHQQWWKAREGAIHQSTAREAYLLRNESDSKTVLPDLGRSTCS